MVTTIHMILRCQVGLHLNVKVILDILPCFLPAPFLDSLCTNCINGSWYKKGNILGNNFFIAPSLTPTYHEGNVNIGNLTVQNNFTVGKFTKVW